jgi:hypothetical protein
VSNHQDFTAVKAAAAALSFLALSCEPAAPTAPPLGLPAAVSPALGAAPSPAYVPLFVVIDDINPCTGLPVTLTYEGTARVQEFGDHFVLHVNGSVETTDGFSGSFSWTLIFQGDRIAHVSAHDMEISDATGQIMIFPIGLEQHVTADGELVVDLFHFSKDRVRCVGPGSH